MYSYVDTMPAPRGGSFQEEEEEEEEVVLCVLIFFFFFSFFFFFFFPFFAVYVVQYVHIGWPAINNTTGRAHRCASSRKNNIVQYRPTQHAGHSNQQQKQHNTT